MPGKIAGWARWARFFGATLCILDGFVKVRV